MTEITVRCGHAPTTGLTPDPFQDKALQAKAFSSNCNSAIQMEINRKAKAGYDCRRRSDHSRIQRLIRG